MHVNSALRATTTTSAYTVDRLTCGSTYNLSVYAYDAAGNSSSPASLASNTQPCSSTGGAAPVPPAAFVGAVGAGSLSGSSVAQTGLTLGWSASSDNVGVAGYTVYRDGSQLGQTTSTSYAVSGLACGSSYTFAVEARDAAGNVSSRPSVSLSTSACPDTQAPTSPSNLISSTTNSGTSMTVGWSASFDNVGVTGYAVYLNGSRVSANVAALSYVFGGLTCGTSYTFGVDAHDAAGNASPMTTTITATSPCPDTQAPSAPGVCRVRRWRRRA